MRQEYLEQQDTIVFHPDKKDDLLTIQEVIEKVRTSGDVTATIYINAFAQQQAHLYNH